MPALMWSNLAADCTWATRSPSESWAGKEPAYLRLSTGRARWPALPCAHPSRHRRRRTCPTRPRNNAFTPAGAVFPAGRTAHNGAARRNGIGWRRRRASPPSGQTGICELCDPRRSAVRANRHRLAKPTTHNARPPGNLRRQQQGGGIALRPAHKMRPSGDSGAGRQPSEARSSARVAERPAGREAKRHRVARSTLRPAQV